MIHLRAHIARTPNAWIASLQFPVEGPTEPQPRPRPPTSQIDRTKPVRLDRDMARALVDAGYMPLRRYIQMFATDADERSCIAEVEH
jgi:hypothetical protein